MSVLPADDLRAASAPLFDEGLVDAIEWSVDFGFAPGSIPPWVDELLARYEAKGALFAHGVELSPMTAELAAHQDAWLEALDDAFRRRRFRHLTEHYGFMTAGPIVRGTPLPLPPSRAALDLAAERVRMLQERVGRPVGIENLAFAFGRDDALAQAVFVRELLERTGAFLLLDVHNIHCQAANFAFDPLELASLYGLERVREIHIAGGATSTTRTGARPFRRDSHDDDVPEAAFALLGDVLPRCPDLEVVILERSDRSVFSATEAERYRADFRRVRAIVSEARATDDAPTTRRPMAETGPPAAFIADDRAALASYQRALLETLSSGVEPTVAALVARPPVLPYGAHVRGFEPHALEVGGDLALEWCAREIPEDAMEAAVLRRPGAPLAIVSLPVPAPGPGQVLVRSMAVGLCGTDAHAFGGRFPIPTPIVLGHETVGVIEAVGSGVDSLRPGDRVGVRWIQRTCGACPACARGAETRCPSPVTWIENGGGLSELVVAEAGGCTTIPEALSFDLAAPLFCAGHVAMSALRRAQARVGERVAVLGVGGLGHLAIQIARAEGHEVVAVTSSEEKARDARDLGAHDAIVAGGDAGEALASIGGADIVLATTSSMADVGAAVMGLREGGRLVVVGLGAGSLAIDPAELVQREASLIGSVQGPVAELEQVLALAASGLVVPRVETFPLHLVNRALGRLSSGRARYRAVIEVG